MWQALIETQRTQRKSTEDAEKSALKPAAT